MQMKLKYSCIGKKRVCKVVRIAFQVMIRKLGKANKRMHTIFIHNLMTSFDRRDIDGRQRSFGSSISLFEYEFSCNNTPETLFYHRPNNKVINKTSSSFRFFFCRPCLSDVSEALDLDRRVVFPDKTPCDDYFIERDNMWDDDYEIKYGNRVDDAAEEFIKRFYEQLKGERL